MTSHNFFLGKVIYFFVKVTEIYDLKFSFDDYYKRVNASSFIVYARAFICLNTVALLTYKACERGRKHE